MDAKKLGLGLVIAGIVVLIAVFIFVGRGDTLTVVGSDTSITIEVVDTPETRSQGLSGRESLGQDDGMLFVFDNELIPSFWMKDMNFALDMVWIDDSRTIIAVTENVAPETYPETFSPPSEIMFVLEVNANRAQALGLVEGAQVDF